MYSIITNSGVIKSTSKGVTRAVKKHFLKHQAYKDCLFNEQNRVDKMVRIGQENHILYTLTQNKNSLSPFNDKVFITRQGDEFISRSFGHFEIKNMN